MHYHFNFLGITFDFTLLTLFGLTGNILFTSRILVQWVASERHQRCVTPIAFWWISLCASAIYIIYAYARRDIPMLLGQAINLAPYIRNLRIAYAPQRPARTMGPLLFSMTIFILASISIWNTSDHKMTIGLLFLGFVGNIIYSSRFFVQWIQSERLRESHFSLSFWMLSTVGSIILLFYSLLRGDLVFLLSFTFNVIPYARNIYFIINERHALEQQSHLQNGV